ncbi:MAG: preprotein translocase subunit YajC [Bryobacteraceae bacterium]
MILTFYLQTGTPSGPLGSLAGLLPILLIFGIFYFLLFMPMQKQRKQQKAMLAGLQNGVEVVTSGGIIGTVVAIDADKLVLRVKPDNVKLQVTRGSVASLVSSETKKAQS